MLQLYLYSRFDKEDLPKYLKTTCNCCKPVYDSEMPRLQDVNIDFKCQDSKGNYTVRETRLLPFITKCQCQAC